MKKSLLFSSIFGIFVFSGCSTKYFHKTDIKQGICEESLYTTNSNLSNQIVVGNKSICNNCICNKTPSKKVIKRVPKTEPFNINITVQ